MEVVMSGTKIAVTAILASIFFSASAFATEQVYHPVSPTFGGNPLNGSFLLSTAQAQGNGVKSGQQSPDLSGLNSALSNIGTGTGTGNSPIVIVSPNTVPTNP
jgi:curli production assembly/transport component CsgF